MFDLPSSARVDRVIPKTKFYERNQLTTRLKDEFIQCIGRITWSYKLAETTVNIQATPGVTELQIFHIELRQRQLPMKALSIVDKTIPYPILFVMTYESNTCYVIQYKLDSAKRYYKTEWNQLPELSFIGSTLEVVYQRIIASLIEIDDAPATQSDRPFEEIIATNTRRQQLEKEIAVLENKMRSERQFSRKVSLNSELQTAKQQLERLL